jgi:hypothetical protein
MILMKKMLLAAMLAVSGVASAGATIDIASPPGIYAEGVVTLDDAGTVRWNSRAVDTFYQPYVLYGECEIDISVNAFTNQQTKIGFTCAGPGAVHFTTTGQLWSTCAYDGAILESGHLTLQLDGNTFYDQQLWPNPIVCYLTEAKQAVSTWVAPVVTFNNSAQARTSAASAVYVTDPNWLYSKHTFVVPDGVTCGPNLLNVGTRFRKVYKEVGFICRSTVPASTTYTVTLN